MCETKRMLYTCGHEGTHLLIRSCDTGFDWPAARCTVQRERVAGWYERNERCQRCRNRNRPRVGGALRADTLVDSEKNETKSQSSGRTRQLRHEESWDCETLENSETNKTESRSSRSTRLPKIEEYPEPIKAADGKTADEKAAYEKKKNHREILRRLEGRSGRRTGVDKHNRAWEYRVRTGELEAESDSCLLM